MSKELDLDELDFEQDLKINVIEIGDEWMRVPALIQKYGRLTANAANKKEMTKARLEHLKASLDFDIRKNPENYDNLPTDPKTGAPKLTETVIANAIILDRVYEEKNCDRIDAIYEYANSKVLLDTIEYKVKALDAITKLVLAGWYGELKGGDQEGLQKAINTTAEHYAERSKLETVEKQERKILKRKPLKKR